MQRPVYETPETERSEVAAADAIGNCLNCAVLRNKKFYPADYSFVRDGKTMAFGEIKVRRNVRNRYPTLFISAEKVARCRVLARESGVKFLLFVWWLDGLFWLDATSSMPAQVTTGGRTDRGDPSDIEPLVHFPVTDFILLSRQERRAA